MDLDPRVRERVLAAFDRLRKDGEIHSATELAVYYDTFRKRFGPEVLASIDGEALLNTMHRNGDRASLVYWLEYKNDDELPDIFGGIGGGTSLKFGFFWSGQRQAWVTGTPQNQQVI